MCLRILFWFLCLYRFLMCFRKCLVCSGCVPLYLFLFEPLFFFLIHSCLTQTHTPMLSMYKLIVIVEENKEGVEDSEREQRNEAR